MFRRRALVTICMFALLSPICIYAEIDHWESLIYAGDSWRYFVGNAEPVTNWRTLTFEDASWLQGPGGIGYGDDDDATVIEETTSVYLRMTFDVVDVSTIEAAILHMDYDDGFVAYINDVEIARANVSGRYPAHDQTADENHEAQMYQNNMPEAYYIDNQSLQSFLLQGENVLTIQVHNVSPTSSDLSSIAFLSVGLSTADRTYRDTPNWFDVPFAFTSSDIPIMIIDTQGAQIVDEPKTMARMGMIDNGPGQRNHLTDAWNEYDGWIGIEYRGNASMSFPKKPFTFETRNEDGSDDNIELLGMPRENDFILRAAFIDKTLMRDAIAYYLSRSMGRWAPRTRHVELVLNGSYEGVYILVEKIKPDDNRLAIVRMDTTDIAGEALTGGYVWSVQQPDFNDVVFLGDRSEGNSRVLKYPKPDEVTREQIDYIHDYEESFRMIMRRPSFNDPVTGYPAYIDVSTFIDEIIVQEITSNSDAYGWSSYFYKDRNAKMSAGPAWDFDQALSNSTYNDGDRVDAFVIEKTVDWARPSFWDRLWSDDGFREQVSQKWVEYRRGPLQLNRIFAFVDSVATYLNEAQTRNFQQWPILGVPIWRSTAGVEHRDTYQKEVDYMKEYVADHVEWLDSQLGDPGDVDSENEMNTSVDNFELLQNFPNPFNPGTTIRYRVPTQSHVTIKVYNILGEEIVTLVDSPHSQGSYTTVWNARDALDMPVSHGLYLYKMQTDGFQDVKKMLLIE